jgi:putative spermidine/putrescine transport system permease protein
MPGFSPISRLPGQRPRWPRQKAGVVAILRTWNRNALSYSTVLNFRPAWLVTPVLALLALIYVYPVVSLLLISVQAPHWSFSYYTRILSDPITIPVLIKTFELAAEVTLLCAVFGYPLAYLMARSGPRWQKVIALLVVIPLWTSVLVRAYAWIVLLGRNGVINQLLTWLDLIKEPLPLLYNKGSVCVGMMHVMLPLFVLPLYGVMKRIDFRLVMAAQSLGSTRMASFFLIVLPRSIPGIAAGASLVFIFSLGFYVTPALLGGLQDLTYVMLIEKQVSELLNWEIGAAMSVLLMVVMLIFCIVLSLVATRARLEASSALPVWVARRLVLASIRMRRRFDSATVGGKINNLRQRFAPRPTMQQDGQGQATGATIKIIGIIAIVFLVAPLTILLPLSFSAAPFLQFPPRGYSTRWYDVYFSRSDWIMPTITSFEVALITMFLATLFGGLAAIGLVRTKASWVKPMTAFIVSPIMVPTLIVSIGLYLKLAPFKLAGTVAGLVIGHLVIAIPVVVIPITAALRIVDLAPERAARSLGANPVRAFLKTTFSYVRPSILTAAFLAFLSSFDDLVIALFMSGPGTLTLPKRIWEGIQFEIDPTIAAVSVLMITLSFVLLSIAELVEFRTRAHQEGARKVETK